ncbi:MAG: hypothetical protein OXH05_01795 [Acidobacteria bacterium]|nr:hypothetical protein [Acidobacteriota bacterium]
MTESKWGRVRDNTVPVLLGTLMVALFYTTASTQGRMADMENRLGERISALSDRSHDADKDLSERIGGLAAELSDRIHGAEKSLSDQLSGMEKRLSDRITRLETLMEIHLEAHSAQAASGGVR